MRSRAAGARSNRSPRSTPTNLRPALASFVGRHDDLARVGELLDEHRLVTLVGAGGCGKTRLATEIASQAARQRSPAACGSPPSTASPGATPWRRRSPARSGCRPPTPPGSRSGERRRAAGAAAVDAGRPHGACWCSTTASTSPMRPPTWPATCSPRRRACGCWRRAARRCGSPARSVWRVPPLDDRRTRWRCSSSEHGRRAPSSADVDDGDAAPIAEFCERVDGMPLAIELPAARTQRVHRRRSWPTASTTGSAC